MANLSAADATVSEALVNEINSITAVTGDAVPSYEPQAWTREGQVD